MSDQVLGHHYSCNQSPGTAVKTQPKLTNKKLKKPQQKTVIYLCVE